MTTYDFRKGDIVTVQATVRWDYDAYLSNRLMLDIEGCYSPLSVDPSMATIDRPFVEVGERVRLNENGTIGTVFGVFGDRVWVDDNIYPLSRVIREPREPEQPLMAAG